MVAMSQTLFGNKFLACLNGEVARLLLPHLKSVSLAERDTIYEPGDSIEHVYFPVSSVISSVTIMNDGATVEVSMIGKENIVGLAILFGEEKTRNLERVLIPGDALRMKADVLRELFDKHKKLRSELMYCYRRIISQVSQRAVCSSRHTIIHRLCCWLLMVHDRAAIDDFPLTHDLIAGQLGTRRAGITRAASVLQAAGAIRYHRGQIHISERLAIERAACECYPVYKDEFSWTENRARV